jgi:hypothetical protein
MAAPFLSLADRFTLEREGRILPPNVIGSERRSFLLLNYVISTEAQRSGEPPAFQLKS